MRSRHCRVCGDWHLIEEAWPAACAAHFAIRGPRSSLPMPMIIRDGMEPIVSMVDGKVHDSKRAYAADVRAAGCEIVGNDIAPFQPGPREYVPQGVGQDVKDAIEQLQARG